MNLAVENKVVIPTLTIAPTLIDVDIAKLASAAGRFADLSLLAHGMSPFFFKKRESIVFRSVIHVNEL